MPVATPVKAADGLIVTYGTFFEGVFSVADLANFVETGEVPIALRLYLRRANLDPEVVRNALDEDLDISFEFLDRTMNSLPDEFLLFQIGRVVHTPVCWANIKPCGPLW